MTKLHMNYKDAFRALRLGFSAKKIWIMSQGLLVGFAGYALATYLAQVVSGNDFLTVWETHRLLPFLDPALGSFPWYAWVIHGAGALFFIASVLVSGTAVSKVTFEQLRGDEFYESKEAYRFAFRHLASVVFSPLMIIGFVAVIVVAGLLLSALGAIPYVGEILVGLLVLPALAASFFIVYLLIVLLCSLLIGPSVVGATKNDTFDTIFEVFSCVNEQPARLVLYVGTAAVLSKVGGMLFGLATSAAGRVGYFVLQAFTGHKVPDLMYNAAFYFQVSLPSWTPSIGRSALEQYANLVGLPQMYRVTDFVPLGWSYTVGALAAGASLYIIALLVAAYGCSVWYTANTLNYAVLAHKKDEKNILEVPEDEEELIEPVPQPAPAEPKPEQKQG